MQNIIMKRTALLLLTMVAFLSVNAQRPDYDDLFQYLEDNDYEKVI